MSPATLQSRRTAGVAPLGSGAGDRLPITPASKRAKQLEVEVGSAMSHHSGLTARNQQSTVCEDQQGLRNGDTTWRRYLLHVVFVSFWDGLERSTAARTNFKIPGIGVRNPCQISLLSSEWPASLKSSCAILTLRQACVNIQNIELTTVDPTRFGTTRRTAGCSAQDKASKCLSSTCLEAHSLPVY